MLHTHTHTLSFFLSQFTIFVPVSSLFFSHLSNISPQFSVVRVCQFTFLMVILPLSSLRSNSSLVNCRNFFLYASQLVTWFAFSFLLLSMFVCLFLRIFSNSSYRDRLHSIEIFPLFLSVLLRDFKIIWISCFRMNVPFLCCQLFKLPFLLAAYFFAVVDKRNRTRIDSSLQWFVRLVTRVTQKQNR